ncbi:MAG: hypothetical protein GY711_05115 [bacterium]|nr:hypothetical protein [bacterium]
MLRILSLATGCMLLAQVGQAQLLIGTSSYSTGETHQVDVASGTAMTFALTHPTTGTQVPCTGMAADDANGALYVSSVPISGDDVELYRWGYGDPTATVLSAFGSPIFDTITGGSVRCEALAFGGGTLYAVHQISTGAAPEGIYVVNLSVTPITATLVHQFLDPSIDIGGLGFDPTSGLFYGSNDGPAYAAGRGLVSIDVASQTETWLAAYPPGVDDIDAVAVAPGNTVYLVEDQAGNTIHPYVLQTGVFAPSEPSPVQLTWLFAGAAWAPNFDGPPGPIGTSYCSPAVPNSSGLSSVISAVGSLTAADNDVRLTANDLPPGQFGYFLAGQAQGMATPPGSQGVICMMGNIGRYDEVPEIIQGPTGNLRINLNAIPVNPPQAAVAGETWLFQCWYRDNNPALTNNFTDGLSITFE